MIDNDRQTCWADVVELSATSALSNMTLHIVSSTMLNFSQPDNDDSTKPQPADLRRNASARSTFWMARCLTCVSSFCSLDATQPDHISSISRYQHSVSSRKRKLHFFPSETIKNDDNVTSNVKQWKNEWVSQCIDYNEHHSVRFVNQIYFTIIITMSSPSIPSFVIVAVVTA